MAIAGWLLRSLQTRQGSDAWLLFSAVGIAAEKFDQGTVFLEFLQSGGHLSVFAVISEIDVENIFPVLLFGGPGLDLGVKL